MITKIFKESSLFLVDAKSARSLTVAGDKASSSSLSLVPTPPSVDVLSTVLNSISALVVVEVGAGVPVVLISVSRVSASVRSSVSASVRS